MAIHLYWDDDDLHTLLCIFDGRWTWDELFATLRTIKRITEDVDHEVAAIIDVRKGMALPGGNLLNPTTLNKVKNLLRMGEEDRGPMVIVGVNSFIRMIYDTMQGMNRQAVANVHFVHTLCEARELLEHRDERMIAS